ncbi:MAG: MBL fold metallo-hydrolase [Candidatus Methanomethylophilaceae archaeon]|nr:MBL fold metallo-hydrolase [Candidatus Methanomethylophilaceae archaeon]
MTEELMKRTFTTRTPDKPGAFMRACKVIMDNGGNITRVSYKSGALNLFIEVEATREVLGSIEKGLSDMAYVDAEVKVPVILVMEVKIPKTPGKLFPVLEIIDRYDVNISYLNSREENRGFQNFKIGMEVSDPEVSKKILDEVSDIYLLNVVSYNGNYEALDITVGYIRLASKIQKLFSLEDDKVKEFVKECRGVTELLLERGQDPAVVFDKVRQLADFIAYHRDLNFNPRITTHQLTEETSLTVIEPPCGSNTYVLRNDDSLLFVDSGMGIFSDEMITELRETYPAFFSMRKTMLVTHADADHCGLLSEMDNAEIAVDRRTADGLFDMARPTGDKDAYNYCYGRLCRIITDYVAPKKDIIRIIGDAPESREDFVLLDKIKFGDIELEVYEGPGEHTKGQTVILCRQPKLLFTGDLYSNTKDVTPERAEYNQIAPYMPKDSEDDLNRLTRDKLGRIMDSIGRKGMIICGGHGNIKTLGGE